MIEHGDVADDDRLSGWLDGTLDETNAAELAAACTSDPRWARARDELVEVRTLVRALEATEPPPGFLESLVATREITESVPTASAGPSDIEVARSRRHRRASSGVAALAAAAAVAVAFMVPSLGHVKPALATDIRVHQAGVASSGDPISGLAPLGTGMKFGR